MKDRIPVHPGRVRLIPVPGQDGYFDMVRADEPTQVGTPLNKASLLTDFTADALSLGENPTVNDALYSLGQSISSTPLGSDLMQYMLGTHPILCSGPFYGEKVEYLRWKVNHEETLLPAKLLAEQEAEISVIPEYNDTLTANNTEDKSKNNEVTTVTQNENTEE